MAKIEIPKTNYIPHPEGSHEGKIYEIEDKGQIETSFGLKHKIAIKIQSNTATMDDGQPFEVQRWCTVSGHPKSDLRKLRETLLGRKLTDEEAYNLDTNELLEMSVGYVVVHNEGNEGQVYSNIQNIWPLKTASGPPAPPAQHLIDLGGACQPYRPEWAKGGAGAAGAAFVRLDGDRAWLCLKLTLM